MAAAAPEHEGIGNAKADLFVEIPHVKIYRLVERSKELAFEGPLRIIGVGVEDSDQIYVLVIEGFRLALLKSHAAIIRVAPRQYMVPGDELFYGIVIPEEADQDSVDVLESILSDSAVFKVKATKAIVAMPDVVERDRMAEVGVSIANGVEKSALVISHGIAVGAQKIGVGLKKGAAYFKSNTKPSDDDAKVSDETKDRVKKAKMASGAVVAVSKAVVVGAVACASAMSSYLSDAARETEFGKKIDTADSARAEAAKKVAKNTLVAAVTLYEAVHDGVVEVLGHVTSVSAEMIEHKYGHEAGEVSREGLGVVRDVGAAMSNMSRVGAGALAGRAVAGAAVDLAADDQERAAIRAGQVQVDPMMVAGGVMMAQQLNGLEAQAQARAAAAKPAAKLAIENVD